MKLQHLAVIFVLIMLPITLVMGEYIQTQIETIKLQTLYMKSLNTATYDALKAYQINSVNDKYSSLSDSKTRNIEASISTFYNSLSVSMEEYASSREDLSAFVPAILFTLYDGYYIYSSYNNLYSTTGTGDNERIQIQNTHNYQTGLRPYIYYSCQYRLSNGKTIVINYTLDNAITVYGEFRNAQGVYEYQVKSGYLIDYRKVTNVNRTNKTLTYDGITIGPETLTEHLLTIEDETAGTTLERDYPYIVYNNQKVYQDVDSSGNPIYENTQVPVYNAAGQLQYDGNGNIRYQTVRAPRYFWYANYKKTYLQSEKQGLLTYINSNGVGFRSISAYEYYTEAYEFSKWLVEESGLASVTQANIVQNDGTIGANTVNGELYLSVNTNTLDGCTSYIFDTTKTGNDPLISSSTFNIHRMAVIRKSIETNLVTAIANYNSQSGSTYEFVMPIIDETNWDKITNNVSLISFMQGMPISHKYYNNYSVITNTKNEEVINEQSVYIMVQNSDGNYEYHQPGCKELIEMQKSNPNLSMTAYTDLSFMRQTVKVNEVRTRYFYPQSRVGRTTTGCYNCIVNASGDYDIDSIISGQVRDYYTGNVLYTTNQLTAVRRAYLTGIARERQDLYKNNFN